MWPPGCLKSSSRYSLTSFFLSSSRPPFLITPPSGLAPSPASLFLLHLEKTTSSFAFQRRPPSPFPPSPAPAPFGPEDRVLLAASPYQRCGGHVPNSQRPRDSRLERSSAFFSGKKDGAFPFYRSRSRSLGLGGGLGEFLLGQGEFPDRGVIGGFRRRPTPSGVGRIEGVGEEDRRADPGTGFNQRGKSLRLSPIPGEPKLAFVQSPAPGPSRRSRPDQKVPPRSDRSGGNPEPPLSDQRHVEKHEGGESFKKSQKLLGF